MKSQSCVAERTLIARDAQGEEFPSRIAVGSPYRLESHGDWACPVEVEGLHEQLRDQVGVDSWQALQLAFQLVGQLLGYFIQDGGTLYWPDNQEQVTVSELQFMRNKYEPATGDTGMEPDDRRRGFNGVVASLLDASEDNIRMTLDDVENRSGTPSSWSHRQFVTSKVYDRETLENLQLSDEEFADFGHYIVARLLALRD